MQKIIFIFLFLSLTACGQTQNAKLMDEIKNSKTSNHINIPGTRVFIIPPTNFKVSTTFIGLQKSDKAIFNIYDLVDGNFYSNAATFNKESFEKQGIRVFEYKELKVNGYPAKYVSLQGEVTTKAYGLVFGDTTFSTMIMAVYPVTDETTGKEILNSLNTIFYDKDTKIDPFATANFTLNDNASIFKFKQYNANLFIYSIGGVENKEDKDAPAVIVIQMPKDNSMTVKSIADMMLAKLQQYGLTNAQIKNISTEKINGYDSYQTEVYGQMKENNSLIYYCVVAKDDKTIVFQGIAKNDIENNLSEFKKLVNTIKLK